MEPNLPTQGWGKIMLARRYEPMAPSSASECYTNMVQHGLRNAPQELIDYVEALEQLNAVHGLTPTIKRPDRLLQTGDVREAEFNKTMHWASNALARKLLKSDCDSICFIDSDAEFGSNALEELREDAEGWDYDILQAFTVKRGYPPEPMYFMEFAEQPQSPETQARGTLFTTQLPIDPNFIYRAGAVSLHFTLIRRWVFEALLDAMGPEHTYWFEYKQDQGEDMTFSVNARKVGARMGMTTRLKVAHGSYLVMGWASMIDYYDTKFRVDAGEPAPSAERLHQYFLAEHALAGLVGEYTGESAEAVMQKGISATHIVKDQWNLQQPVTVEEVEAFYGTTHAYLYELVRWNASPAYQRMQRRLEFVRGERVLEIGGGIGTLTEFLAVNGNRVEYYDVPGVLRDFAAWRFQRLPLSAAVLMVERWEMWDAAEPASGYDRVIAIDVLEHVHPERAALLLDGLALALKPGGILFVHHNFSNQNRMYPQHYDHAALWEAFLEKYGFVRAGELEWRKP